MIDVKNIFDPVILSDLFQTQLGHNFDINIELIN